MEDEEDWLAGLQSFIRLGLGLGLESWLGSTQN
jgi:hypothetical protein